MRLSGWPLDPAYPQERLDLRLQDSRARVVLSEPEQRLLLKWSGRRRRLPEPCLIQRLFEEIVGDSPHSIALVEEEKQLSYSPLDTRSIQLAQRLDRKALPSVQGRRLRPEAPSRKPRTD